MAGKRHGLAAMALALAAIFTSPAALAHAHLQQQIPAADSVNNEGVSVLKLTFSEQIEPTLSSVSVIDASGNVVTSHQAKRSPDTTRQLLVLFDDPLKSGQYQVEWQVVSVDSHKTQGNYSFSVK
ncbi:hypothetical protein TUM12370_15050 [Salmonella enterica subsp. enterica serovar Choleraesuis]|nr:hypothetical protein TUM12370_15050 [Salmonella enterica subsp. enterica serovar Choleraesuis]